jgi:tetratricopeptide (TPR) repeat protein
MSDQPLVIRTLGPLTLEGLKLDLPSLQALTYVVRQQEEQKSVTVEQVAELVWEDSADPLASFKVSRSTVNKQTQIAFGFNAYERPKKGVLKVVNIVSDVKLLEDACSVEDEAAIQTLCKGLFFENADVTDALAEWRGIQQKQIRGMVWNTYLGLATSRRDRAIAYMQTAFELLKRELPDDEREPQRVSALKRLFFLLQAIEKAGGKMPEQLLEDFVPNLEWVKAAEDIKNVENQLQLWQTEAANSSNDKLEQRLRAVLKESNFDKFEQMTLIAQDLYKQHEQRLHYLNSSDRLLIYYALQATEHPLSHQVSEKLRLSQTGPDQARLRLVTTLLFLDRKRIQKTLNNLIALRAGKWAWVYGKPGAGKSLLLEQFLGSKLDGKAEPAYETLKPLLEKGLSELGDHKTVPKESVEKRLLENLLQSLDKLTEKTLLIDNWENVDAESQRLLEALNKSSRTVTVIITSTHKAPPKTLQDVQVLELGNLSRDDIDKDITELFEQTGGIPYLVAANLKDESISDALKIVLKNLSEKASDFYFAQALLDNPNHELVCRALNITREESHQIQNELMGYGLMQGNGDINPREVGRTYLKSEAARDFARLSFALAKVLPSVEAQPYFRNSKSMWHTEDYPAIEKAYLEYVGSYVDRESPKKLLELLENLEAHFSLLSQPKHPDLTYLKAQLYSQTGDFFKALKFINTLEETPKVLALKAELLLLANDTPGAEVCAQRAATSSDEAAKALSLNTLGKMTFFRGDLDQALSYFEKAARLWKKQGQQIKRARSLMNQANVRSEQARLQKTVDDSVLTLYEEALNASDQNPLLSPQLHHNQGIQHHLRGTFTKNRKAYSRAEDLYRQAIAQARKMHLEVTEAEAQCSLAELYVDTSRFFGEKPPESDEALTEAYRLAHKIADETLTARVEVFRDVFKGGPQATKKVEKSLQTLWDLGRRAEAVELCQYLPENNQVRLSFENHAG